MAEAFIVAENYSDVTQTYLKASLEYQYRGKSLNFSDDLLITLESDFKRKAKNLDWLFQGKTRIHLTPTAEKVFESVKKDTMAEMFLTMANSFGYTYTKEQFVSGYMVVDKQVVKLNKVKSLMFSKENIQNAGKLPKNLFDKFTSNKLQASSNKYRPESSPLNDEKSLVGVNDLFVNNKNLVVAVHPKSAVVLSWKDTGYIDVDHIINQMNSTEVILSIDINDFITCSEGGVSSCMSMSNSYHLGWMLHYRSDFSIMTFTHKKGDSFYKTGRTWTFLKLTEDALPFSRPFYKLSKVYGALNASHIGIVDSYIQKQAKDILDLDKPTKHTNSKKAEYGSIKHIVSANMKNTTGSTTGTGYFDWDTDHNSNWELVPLWEYKGEFPVVPFNASNYQRGPICLFNFPDALDVDGAPTNEGAFRNTPQHNPNMFAGWPERYKQFVTCKATNKRILFRDALELNDGSFISKSIAASIVSGTPVEVKEEQEEVTIVTTPTISPEEVDVTDF